LKGELVSGDRTPEAAGGRTMWEGTRLLVERGQDEFREAGFALRQIEDRGGGCSKRLEPGQICDARLFAWTKGHRHWKFDRF